MQRISLGGREYLVADLDRMTFAQAHYLQGHAERIGLDRALPREGEGDVEYEERLRRHWLGVEDMPAVLAAYLTPVGESWSIAVAHRTRELLEALTDPDDHGTLMSIAYRVTPDFFGRALALSVTSRICSASAMQPKPGTAAH